MNKLFAVVLLSLSCSIAFAESLHKTKILPVQQLKDLGLVGDKILSMAQDVWREDYTPFGEKFNGSAANDNLGSYTGHIHDSATGLSYMQARYYDPVIGRFLSNDPVGFKAQNPMSFNRYTYGNNNPVLYVDPDGESAITVVVVAGIAIGAIIFGMDYAFQAMTDLVEGKKAHEEAVQNGKSTDAAQEQIDRGAAKVKAAAAMGGMGAAIGKGGAPKNSRHAISGAAGKVAIEIEKSVLKEESNEEEESIEDEDDSTQV